MYILHAYMAKSEDKDSINYLHQARDQNSAYSSIAGLVQAWSLMVCATQEFRGRFLLFCLSAMHWDPLLKQSTYLIHWNGKTCVEIIRYNLEKLTLK